jgi:PleD family two-component response regulator
MNLRVLLADSDPEDLLFLEDVLIEMEEGQHWGTWVSVETLAASSLAETLSLLQSEAADVILLNLTLQDSRGAATYRAVQALRPDTPVILIARAEERELAAQLIREGAQDFLPKAQLDCAPLAHAIRNGMERQRLLAAARATSVVDPLTGLLNRSGFFSMAECHRLLAEQLGRRFMLIAAELRQATQSEQHRDLALMEIAERLRALAGSTHLLARVSATSFAIGIIETPLQSLELTWARLRTGAEEQRIAIGTAIFDADHPLPLEALLEQAELDLSASIAPKALAMRP